MFLDKKIAPWLDEYKLKSAEKFKLRRFKGFSDKQMTLNTDRYIPQRIRSDIFGVYLNQDDSLTLDEKSDSNSQATDINKTLRQN